jgi:hypothetical protein
LRQFLRHDLKFDEFGPSNYRQGRFDADLCANQGSMKVIDAGIWANFESDYDISLRQAAALGSSARVRITHVSIGGR